MPKYRCDNADCGMERLSKTDLAVYGSCTECNSFMRQVPYASMSSVERYDTLAEEFRRETGCHAPGKDIPTASHQLSQEERELMWRKWLVSRSER